MLNVLRNRTISEQLYALAGIVFLGFALVVGLWAQTRAVQDRAFDAHMGSWPTCAMPSAWISPC